MSEEAKIITVIVLTVITLLRFLIKIFLTSKKSLKSIKKHGESHCEIKIKSNQSSIDLIESKKSGKEGNKK